MTDIDIDAIEARDSSDREWLRQAGIEMPMVGGSAMEAAVADRHDLLDALRAAEEVERGLTDIIEHENADREALEAENARLREGAAGARAWAVLLRPRRALRLWATGACRPRQHGGVAMSAVTYHAIVCDVVPCGEESSFEPSASGARLTALREGWHYRHHRLGERWFCPAHEAEWRANSTRLSLASTEEPRHE